MKKTPLYDKHIALGAKMVPFAGYEMAVSYDGIKQEHQLVREAVGIFDVSHMGEFMVEGPEASKLIQYVTSNDVSKLFDGKVQYSCLPNGKGGIVDDLLVYRISEEKYMLVVNASNMEKDWDWINKNNKWNCVLEDHSEGYGLLAVQGPNASKALASLTSLDLEGMDYYAFDIGEFAGIPNVIVSATGYTGSGGFEIYVKNQDAVAVWDAVMEAGKEYGIGPAGLGARDTLRLEMGFCLYGNDINDETSPLEAGLGWITKLNVEEDFIDKEFLKRQKEAGLKRKLVGFEMMERGIPRQHYAIVDVDGNEIGEVTSGSESLSTGKFVGMGYVPIALSKSGSEIFIQIRKKTVRAQVCRPPFYKVG